MGKIFAIACMMVLLMSTGLVSGERIAIESYPHSSEADLQINVDNINGYLVANVYVHVGGEERALTCPFGDRHIDIRYGITNVQYVSWWDELSQPALDGWNKALKDVDRGTGKKLLEDLGNGRADGVGKNLAGMSDDAAEWMVESEIGRTALKGWGDDAQKGLAEIFEGEGERFTDNLVRRFGGEVEIVSKGVGRGVIDVEKVNPEKSELLTRLTILEGISFVFKNEDSYWYPEMKAFLEGKGVLVEVL